MASGLTLPPNYAEDILYAAYRDRLLIKSLGIQAGVVGAEDYKVSAGSGLQVNVKAGNVFVEQTGAIEESSNAFYNGMYQVPNPTEQNPYNSVEVSASNPQIAQIILRVYDVGELKIGGSSYGRIEWLNGSANAGATKAHVEEGKASEFGAAVLSASSFRISYVVVPKNATKSSEYSIVDVRTFSNKINLENLIIEKSYSKAEAEAGSIPSVTRGAFVNLVVISIIGNTVQAEIKVAGVLAGEVCSGAVEGAFSSRTPCPVWTNPGQKWTLVAGSTNVLGIAAFTKLL